MNTFKNYKLEDNFKIIKLDDISVDLSENN